MRSRGEREGTMRGLVGHLARLRAPGRLPPSVGFAERPPAGGAPKRQSTPRGSKAKPSPGWLRAERNFSGLAAIRCKRTIREATLASAQKEVDRKCKACPLDAPTHAHSDTPARRRSTSERATLAPRVRLSRSHGHALECLGAFQVTAANRTQEEQRKARGNRPHEAPHAKPNFNRSQAAVRIAPSPRGARGLR